MSDTTTATWTAKVASAGGKAVVWMHNGREQWSTSFMPKDAAESLADFISHPGLLPPERGWEIHEPDDALRITATRTAEQSHLTALAERDALTAQVEALTAQRDEAAVDCCNPDHWFDSRVGWPGKHDGGLPEDAKTPCIPFGVDQ